ncbi:MAG: response regulator [Candidatus Altiarchaeota archaeon]
MRIMCVDDNPADQKMIEHTLTRTLDEEFLFHTSNTAQQLYERLESEKCDIILLDYKLGSDDGIEILKNLRERGDDTPIVFLTGQGSEEIACEALKYGAHDFLTKDQLKSARLAQVIKNIVKRRKAEDEVKLYARELEEKIRMLEAGGTSRYESILQKGNSYLIESKNVVAAVKIFKSMVAHGFKGLCISKLNPQNLKERYDLGNVEYGTIWLSEMTVDGAVSIKNPTEFLHQITTFTRDNEKNIILFLDAPYIRTMQDPKTFIELLQNIQDLVSVKNSRLLISLDPDSMDGKELSILKTHLIGIDEDEIIRILG